MEWCKLEKIELEEMGYTDMMKYVHYKRSQGNKSGTIQQKIIAIRQYFEYLNLTNNPASLVQLQRDTKKSPHRLLDKEEMNEIYKLYPTHGLIKKRDKVLLSLVIYQGVSSSELPLIEIKDIDLMEGKIYIPAMRSSNSRTLELKPFQLMLIQDYIMNIRPKILLEARKQSEKLLVSTGQNANQLANVISQILKRLRPLYPKLKDFKQIRQSVITIWVKEQGLRQAQYMAGHRYVSSTERYNEDEKEGLKNALKSYHPLE